MSKLKCPNCSKKSFKIISISLNGDRIRRVLHCKTSVCRNKFVNYIELGSELNKYRGLVVPPHHCAVNMHRWVYEQKIKRKLFTWEYIHHINGIRGDNRPSNLSLPEVHSPKLHKSYPTTMVKILQMKVRDLEAGIRRMDEAENPKMQKM